VGESTLEDEIRAGRLEAFKLGARTLVSDEAFDRWLASRERIKPKRQSGPETLELA
jgi:excisionase family DNA binding protein